MNQAGQQVATQQDLGGWQQRAGDRRARLWRKVEPVTMDEYQENARKCVLYVVGGKERRTPWFKSPARAQRALEILRTRYGNGIIFTD